MYDKFFYKCDVTSSIPSPVTNCHTFSDPLERDVLYGRPHMVTFWKTPTSLAAARSTRLVIAISQCSLRHRRPGASILGLRVATPRFLAGEVGGRRGSLTGGKILLYLIMYTLYRKYMYVRKWWLLKRNRIICPEIAVNDQFLPGKFNFFVKLPEKSKCVENLPGQILCVKLAEKKSNFSLISLPGSTTPRF